MHVALTIMRCFELWSFLSNLRLTSSPLLSPPLLSPLSPFFSTPFSFKAIPNLSSPFLSFLSQSCRLCSPLLSSLFPLSFPLLFLILRFSQQTHPRAQPGGGATACCSCTLLNCQSSHLSQSEESSLCQSKDTSKYEPWRWEICGKKCGRERVCLPCMCVFWNKANTLCAIFKPHCRVAKDSIF